MRRTMRGRRGLVKKLVRRIGREAPGVRREGGARRADEDEETRRRSTWRARAEFVRMWVVPRARRPSSASRLGLGPPSRLAPCASRPTSRDQISRRTWRRNVSSASVVRNCFGSPVWPQWRHSDAASSYANSPPEAATCCRSVLPHRPQALGMRRRCGSGCKCLSAVQPAGSLPFSAAQPGATLKGGTPARSDV